MTEVEYCGEYAYDEKYCYDCYDDYSGVCCGSIHVTDYSGYDYVVLYEFDDVLCKDEVLRDLSCDGAWKV